MSIFARTRRFARALLARRTRPSGAPPEVWCRPATVLALRDRGLAPACVAGWHCARRS